MTHKSFDRTREFYASKFSWIGKKGSCDLSDLGCKPGQVPFVQVYQDAIDLGLTLIGKRSKRDFILDHEEVDKEGETLWYKLDSTDGMFTITLYND
jgi:hypothetical protein